MAAVDSVIRGIINIEAQNPDLISLSILMGLLTFGPYGAIIGPILSGVTLVLVDIYKTEVHRQHGEGAAERTSSPRLQQLLAKAESKQPSEAAD